MTITEALLMALIVILLSPLGIVTAGYVATKLGLIDVSTDLDVDDATGDNGGDDDE